MEATVTVSILLKASSLMDLTVNVFILIFFSASSQVANFLLAFGRLNFTPSSADEFFAQVRNVISYNIKCILNSTFTYQYYMYM